MALLFLWYSVLNRQMKGDVMRIFTQTYWQQAQFDSSWRSTTYKLKKNGPRMETCATPKPREANSDDLSSIWTNRSPKSLQCYLPHKLIGSLINSNVQINQLCVESLNLFSPLVSFSWFATVFLEESAETPNYVKTARLLACLVLNIIRFGFHYSTIH